MSFHNWAGFALFFLVLSYTPGPNMLLVASHGMLFGPKCTVTTPGFRRGPLGRRRLHGLAGLAQL